MAEANTSADDTVPEVLTVAVGLDPVAISLIGIQQSHAQGVANHGTIKIEAITDPIHPSNDPHPGCPFRLELWGFPAGDYDVTFTGWSPTGGGTLGTDTLTVTDDGQGSEFQVSNEYSFDFSGITAHPQQGYHVRVDVDRVDGGPGQGSKTKVFWLTCAAVGPTTPGETEEEEEEEEEDVPGPTTPGQIDEEDEVENEVVRRTEVRGVQFFRPQVGAEGLATTGAGIVGILLTGLMLSGTGIGMVVSTRRRRVRR